MVVYSFAFVVALDWRVVPPIFYFWKEWVAVIDFASLAFLGQREDSLLVVLEWAEGASLLPVQVPVYSHHWHSIRCRVAMAVVCSAKG